MENYSERCRKRVYNLSEMSSYENSVHILKEKKTMLRNSWSGTPEYGNNWNANGKYFEIFIIAVLFAFGVYHSVLYFGHQVVRNPDCLFQSVATGSGNGHWAAGYRIQTSGRLV